MPQEVWDILRYVDLVIASATFLIMGYQAVRRWRRIYTWKIRVIWLSVFFASAAFGQVAVQSIAEGVNGGYADVIATFALILLLITAIAPIDDGEREEFPRLDEDST